MPSKVNNPPVGSGTGSAETVCQPEAKFVEENAALSPSVSTSPAGSYAIPDAVVDRMYLSVPEVENTANTYSVPSASLAEVSVVSTSNGNRAVTLDRAVTKLRLIFEDAIPADAATFNIIPATWYYGWNYVTGEPCASASNQAVTVNIPSTSIGVVNESVNVYGFSTSAEWTTDVALNSKTSGGEVLGSATITAVPLKANRVSEYSGPLFSSGGTMTMSLNTTWDTSATGTW